jgi:3-dehydroquinate dehydratase-1
MYRGSEAERVDLLIKAAYYADYVDVELMASGRDEVLANSRKPVIVSYHDFQGMPGGGQLSGIYARMKETGAAVAKIAVTPQCLSDNLRILQFLLKADMPLCMIGMGQIGRHLRAVAPLYGSVLTYGFITDSTAPGQMSLDDICLAIKLLNSSTAEKDVRDCS